MAFGPVWVACFLFVLGFVDELAVSFDSLKQRVLVSTQLLVFGLKATTATTRGEMKKTFVLCVVALCLYHRVTSNET